MVPSLAGTAATELSEFNNIYNLSVAVVPTNREILREDGTDVVFKTEPLNRHKNQVGLISVIAKALK